MDQEQLCFENIQYALSRTSCYIPQTERLVRLGYLQCIEFLVRRQLLSWYRVIHIAAVVGNVDILRHAHHAAGHDVMSPELILKATVNGHLSCMKYGYVYGVPWHRYTLLAAYTSGFSECLRYARERGAIWCYDIQRAIPWPVHRPDEEYLGWMMFVNHVNDLLGEFSVIKNPSKWGHLVCMKYIHSAGDLHEFRHGTPYHQFEQRLASQLSGLPLQPAWLSLVEPYANWSYSHQK